MMPRRLSELDQGRRVDIRVDKSLRCGCVLDDDYRDEN